VDVIDEAAARGYQLEQRSLHGQRVWAWRRGDDRRHPCFLTEGEALSCMADRLQRLAIFAPR
jgi:hypothetical protein